MEGHNEVEGLRMRKGVSSWSESSSAEELMEYEEEGSGDEMEGDMMEEGKSSSGAEWCACDRESGWFCRGKHMASGAVVSIPPLLFLLLMFSALFATGVMLAFFLTNTTFALVTEELISEPVISLDENAATVNISVPLWTYVPSLVHVPAYTDALEVRFESVKSMHSASSTRRLAQRPAQRWLLADDDGSSTANVLASTENDLGLSDPLHGFQWIPSGLTKRGNLTLAGTVAQPDMYKIIYAECDKWSGINLLLHYGKVAPCLWCLKFMTPHSYQHRVFLPCSA